MRAPPPAKIDFHPFGEMERRSERRSEGEGVQEGERIVVTTVDFR